MNTSASNKHLDLSLRNWNPRCVWMVLVIGNFIQLVNVLIPQIAHLQIRMRYELKRDNKIIHA